MRISSAIIRLVAPVALVLGLCGFACGFVDGKVAHPIRIVSLSPSTTDLLFDMGLGNWVVGVSRFCMLPAGEKRTIVCDSMSVDTETIISLKPDVILAKGSIDRLGHLRRAIRGVTAETLALNTIQDVAVAMERIGCIVSRPDLAEKYIAKFNGEIRKITNRPDKPPARRVLFVMGTDQPFVAAKGTFIDELIRIAGAVNAGRDVPGPAPWRTSQLEDILSAGPEIIICQEYEPALHERARQYWSKWQGVSGSSLRKVYVVGDRRWTILSTRSTKFAEAIADMLDDYSPAGQAGCDSDISGAIKYIAIGAGSVAAVLVLLGFISMRAAKVAAIGLALLALIAAVVLACSLVGKISLWPEFGWRLWESMIWQARVSRLLAAAVVGVALAVGGMALQGLFRNPLANPYILGVSSGAGVGVLLGMSLAPAIGIAQWAGTPLPAFIGAMITCLLVYGIAQRRGRLDSYSLILSGVIVNTFNAAIMLTIYLYIDPWRIADFARWSMGELPDSVDFRLLGLCGGCILLGWLLMILRGRAFNALSLGDDVARSSGVAVHRLRVEVFLVVAMTTACAVAMTGPIGFIGLIVPHLCRMVLGPEHRRLAIASGLVGAIFLVLADTLCRSTGGLIGVGKIPVGIFTAFCGGPFFIFLLRRKVQAPSQ